MNSIKDELFYSILNTQTNIKASESEMINKVNCMQNYVPKYTYSEYNIDQLHNEYFITSCQISNSIDAMYNEIINEYMNGYDGNGYVQEGVDDWRPITPIGWLIKAIIKVFKFIISLIKSIFTKKDATVSSATKSMDQICKSVLKPNNQVIKERVKIVNAPVKSGPKPHGNVNKQPQQPQQKVSVKVQPVEKSLKFQDQKTGKIIQKKIKFSPYLCDVEVKNKELVYSLKGIDDGKMKYQYKEIYGREISPAEFKHYFEQTLADLINTNGHSKIEKGVAILTTVIANVSLVANRLNNDSVTVSDIVFFEKALSEKAAEAESSSLVTHNVKFSESDTTFTAKQFESATKKLNTLIKLLGDLDKYVDNLQNAGRAYFSKHPEAKQTIDIALQDYQHTVNVILNSYHMAGFEMTIALNIISSRINNFWLASAEYEGTCDNVKDLAVLVRDMISSGVPSSFVGYNAWFVLSPKLRGDVQSDQDAFIPKWGQTRIAFYPSNDLNSVIKVATNSLGLKSTNDEVSMYNSKLKNLNTVIKFHDYVRDKDYSQKVNTLFTAPKSIFENGCVVLFDRCKYTIKNASDKNPDKWSATAKDIQTNIHRAKLLLNYEDIHKNNIGYTEAGEWKIFDYAI